ncbi:platelet glycoprotein 4 [Caerostris extrusa]|uniref:Platelet glycoprotein 4 n=1 Tax=Caerostris extrusa TaxID=172846 RepID=A0AAV4NV55_CAEEX|nr:platelet glycoprotein 4 [Caerostris extrusa]
MKKTIKQLMYEEEDDSLPEWLNRLDCSKNGIYVYETDRTDYGVPTRSSIDVGSPLNMKKMFKYTDPELCRTINFTQSGIRFLDGLKIDQFETSSDINNWNQTLRESCRTSSYNNNCCPGFPIVLSLPHFYVAKVSNSSISNLKLDESIPNCFVEIEPITGLTTNFSLRYQFNVKVKTNKNWSHVHDNIYPLFWVEDVGFSSKYSEEFLFTMLKCHIMCCIM